MNRQVFEIIENIIIGELQNQGFAPAVELEEEDGIARMYALESVAYSVMYSESKSNVSLRSAALSDGKPGDWKNLSSWLYDPETAVKADAESIANDFLDIIRGPKRIEITKKTAKKKKSDERNVDPLFFFNRMVQFIPELKDKMNADRIEFGKIRFATLTNDCIVPAIDEMAKNGRLEAEKMAKLFDDMYKEAELEVRGLLIQGIMNTISLDAVAKLEEYFSEDFAKVYKISKRLRGKVIKPAKPKKKSKLMTNAIENANRFEKEKRANMK